MSERSNVGLLGFGEANVSLATYLNHRGIDVMTWALPNHTGTLPQAPKDDRTLPAQSNGVNGSTLFQKTDSLQKLVNFNKFLILAVHDSAQEPYVAALEEFNHLLQDTTLLVTNAIGFKLLHGNRLNVKYILESNLGPDDDISTAGINGIKEESKLARLPLCHSNDHDLGVTEPHEDVNSLLYDLACFKPEFSRREISSKMVAPLSLKENRPIESFEDIANFGRRDTPVITMFSGGLDSTYLLLKLQQLGFQNIHAVAVDLGAPIDKERLTKYAAHFGATFECLDGRELFVREGVIPAIRAHAMYMGMYPISSSLSRPVIARLITDYARALNAGLLLHTANLSQNSLPRLNNSIRHFGFPGAFGSPYIHSVVSREMKAKELAVVGLAMMSDRKMSGDENLWCREFESGPLDDPESFSIPEDAYQWTQHCNNYTTQKLTLSFERGNLVSVDGKKLPLIEAIALLNREVGKFGHGRFVGLEPIRTDDKVLEVREAPAAAIIMDALRHLEVATLETNALALKQHLEQKWVQEAISGRWRSTCHTMCDTAIASALNGVEGSVTYNIDHMRYLPCSIVARNPRYIRDRDQWEQEQSIAGLNRW